MSGCSVRAASERGHARRPNPHREACQRYALEARHARPPQGDQAAQYTRKGGVNRERRNDAKWELER